MGKKVYDVAVIGAGVFGTWTALRLRQAGNRVVLIDAFGAGNNRSSSGDESRIIRCGYGADEIYTRMARSSLSAWQELFEAGKCRHLFQKSGVLWLGQKNDAYIRKTAQVLKRAGVRSETLSPPVLRERFPQFNCLDLPYALLEPDSGALLGRQAVKAVWKAYLDAGGDFRLGRVAEPETETTLSSITLETGEQIFAAVFVFACGPWLPKVFPQLLRRRLFITRQEVLYFGPPGGTTYLPGNMPVWLDMKQNVYGLPDLDGRGVKAAFDAHGPAFDPDSGNRLVSQETVRRMRMYLARRIPGLAGVRVIETRVCQYENTSNGDFLLDRHPEMDNVWLAGGGSGHGFKHGPAVAEYLRAQIDGSGTLEPRFSLGSKLTIQNRSVF